jgi:hypothetical protein
LFLARQAGFPTAIISSARALALQLQAAQAKQIVTGGDNDSSDDDDDDHEDVNDNVANGGGGGVKCYASGDMHLRLKQYYSLCDALVCYCECIHSI